MDKERKIEMNTLVDRAQASVVGRGMVLHLASELEDLLTSVIAWCFSPTYDELDGEVDSLLSQGAIALKSIILRRVDFNEKTVRLGECVQFGNEKI